MLMPVMFALLRKQFHDLAWPLCEWWFDINMGNQGMMFNLGSLRWFNSDSITPKRGVSTEKNEGQIK